MRPATACHRAFALTLCLSAGIASAQVVSPPPPFFEPSVGQAGKDVIWVPTPQALVDKMLNMAKATPKDYLIDLGSGDGRTVITAAKRGIRAHGIEYNPDMVELSKRNAQAEGVAERATFAKEDLFDSDFSKATVITMFLLDRINLQLRPKLLNLAPGTRIVSNTFTMAEWKADEKVYATEKEGCESYCVAHLWIVPARVAGVWKMTQAVTQGELTLRQEFQTVSGQLVAGDKVLQVSGGRLRGDRLSFTAGGVDYTGRVRGEVIEGAGKGSGAWTAARIRKALPPPPETLQKS